MGEERQEASVAQWSEEETWEAPALIVQVLKNGDVRFEPSDLPDPVNLAFFARQAIHDLQLSDRFNGSPWGSVYLRSRFKVLMAALLHEVT